MKVNTDSMLLGSWAQPGNAKRVLDIGTGSGILALMMAQKASSAAQITAVDIDGLAAAQAAQNFAASPWSTQLQALTGDITSLTLSGRFDVIITNPPYFESVSGDSRAYTTLTTERATARIDDSCGFGRCGILKTHNCRHFCAKSDDSCGFRRCSIVKTHTI